MLGHVLAPTFWSMHMSHKNMPSNMLTHPTAPNTCLVIHCVVDQNTTVFMFATVPDHDCSQYGQQSHEKKR